jgi:Integrase zinc binding domain
MSRLLPQGDPEPDNVEDDMEIMTLPVTVEDIGQAQRGDAKLAELIDAMTDPDGATSKVRRQTRSFVLENGILYRKNFKVPGPTKLLVIPESMKVQILYDIHDGPVGGSHLGYMKTYGKLRSRFYWEGMARQVEGYVKSCGDCQAKKNPHLLPAGLLQPIPVGAPFDMIGIDLLGPLKRSVNRHRFIVTATDYATKWAIARPIPSGGASDVATFIIDNVICAHSCPRMILSDRGSVFRGSLVSEIVKGMGVRSLYTTSYKPSTNGLDEKFNHTLATMLSFYVNSRHDNWCEYVSLCTFSYNVSIQATTKYTPFYLVYGREPTLPIDAGMQPDLVMGADSAERVERLAEARKNVLQVIKTEQAKQKARYDQGRRHVTYKAGQFVKVFFPLRKVGKVEKFMHRWLGPFKIVEKLSDLNYKINLKISKKWIVDTVHVSRMKPWYDPEEWRFPWPD